MSGWSKLSLDNVTAVIEISHMETPPIDRRHFLGTAGATAAFFAMHGAIMAHHSPPARPAPRRRAC